jgi:hypothetical protein
MRASVSASNKYISTICASPRWTSENQRQVRDHARSSSRFDSFSFRLLCLRDRFQLDITAVQDRHHLRIENSAFPPFPIPSDIKETMDDGLDKPFLSRALPELILYFYSIDVEIKVF